MQPRRTSKDFFRQRGWFYERLVREWRQRSRELKSVGILQGIDIKNLTQYVVSYYWNKPKLGPAIAKVSAGELFEGQVYEQVQKTPIEVVYQIFQVSDGTRASLRELAKFKYIKSIRPFAYLAAFALVVRTFQEVGAKWGSPEFTQLMETQAEAWNNGPSVAWRAMVKKTFDHIYGIYTKEAKRAKAHKLDVPSYANYFKSQTPVQSLLKAPLPVELRRAARKVLGS